MTPIELLKRLHTTDLYLSIACAQGIEQARQRLIETYGVYILQVAIACSSSRHVAEEITDRVLEYIFAPDATGEPPIAQYDGRISLAGWMALIVKRMSIREEKRLSSNPGRLAVAKTPETIQIEQEKCLPEWELGGHISGLVNAEERRRLKAHLSACEECRQVIAFYTKHKDELAAVLPPEFR